MKYLTLALLSLTLMSISNADAKGGRCSLDSFYRVHYGKCISKRSSEAAKYYHRSHLAVKSHGKRFARIHKKQEEKEELTKLVVKSVKTVPIPALNVKATPTLNVIDQKFSYYFNSDIYRPKEKSE